MFATGTLPDKVVNILCDVYQKVVFVTCVQPYMYHEHETEFKSDFVDVLLGFVRLCTPEEEICEATVSVSMQIDRFFWHLHSALTPLARDSSFFVETCDVRDDAHKTTAGSKTLQLFNKMGQLTEQWNNNMKSVMSVCEAQVGFEGALLFAEEDMPIKDLEIEMESAMSKAVEDKPVLQEAMQDLHREVCRSKVTFAKSNVSWVKIAVALPNRGKNRKPPVRKQRRPYPCMYVQ